MKSVYIHIPFCKNICSYCDFCKMYYNKEYVNKYLNALEREIRTYYKGERINTLYIGGGTPSALDVDELKNLFRILKLINTDQELEFSFECNIENIDEEKLKFLYINGVNRLSVGVETLHSKHLSFLGRNHTKEEVLKKINLAKQIGFKNISIDLMYALPDQTIKELKEDLELLLKLDVPHVSTYSLIIEPHTKLYINKIKNVSEDLDFSMYMEIKKLLEEKGYNHYEISNFAKKDFKSNHNLTYWNNNEYYGFGLGASGYINDVRYDNTRSFNNYIKGDFRLNEEKINNKIKIENELILGFRKIEGIDKKDFYHKYNFPIEEIPSIKKLIKDGKIINHKERVYLNPNYIYLANDIMIEFINNVI